MINYDKELFISHRDNCIPSMRFYSKRVSSSKLLPRISRFINKYLYKIGIGSSVNRYDNSFTIYSAIQDRKLYSEYQKGEKFINFGSGAFFHHNWKNYDYPGQSKYYKSLQGEEGIDFYPIDLCDDSQRLLIDNQTITLIYSSHTLEHLNYSSADRFLRECYRVLKEDGIIRLALPNTKNDFLICSLLRDQFEDGHILKNKYMKDAASHILSYINNIPFEEVASLFDVSQYDSSKFYDLVNEKYSLASSFDSSNPDRHISYWDYNLLIGIIKKIGFRYCIPCYQGSSFARPFTNISVFDNTEPHISFYVDIIK